VDAQITDNSGRASYRIIRYLRDSVGLQPWTVNGTYFITPLSDELEIIEDNLRFIKLHVPIKLDFYWKGNKYLTTNPYLSSYVFNNDDKMYNWTYRYDKFEPTATIGGKAVSNVYTVSQVDEALNAPVTNATSYGARNLALDKYAKNIGLVYRDYVLWEYQPSSPGFTGGFKTGFGIKMWMIDHN
jgi:DNA modification methylase